MQGPLFHHGDFDAGTLAAIARDSGTTVSVCLPARNEEATVGAIVEAVLLGLPDLVHEVVVVDDGSSDATAEVAAAAGATVVPGPAQGKGAALWTSLQASTGDLVCWLDADLRQFSTHYVMGLVGPLLTHPGVGFVKGFYERTGDGGRVTELMARPLIDRFFPQLAGIRQPLGGEYAGRRSLLTTLRFEPGWGVELGLLVDIAARAGVHAIAQVDLDVRHHRNRSLAELTPQAAEILETALRKAGVEHPAPEMVTGIA